MNINKLIKSYCPNPEVTSDLIFYYVFILDEHSLNSSQKKRIQLMQSKQIKQINPLGFSLNDYQDIQKIILTKSSRKRLRKNIILVTDMKNCEEIIQAKMNGDNMRGVHEIYLCYEQQSRETKQLQDYYPIINKQTHNLDDIIARAGENFKNLRQSRKILTNFKMLDGKNFKKQSYLLKVRAKGCIGLTQKQYKVNRNKFMEYLKRYLSLKNQQVSASFTPIKIRFDNVLQKLTNKNYKQFTKEMLKLYQAPQTLFYEVINNGMMNFSKQNFVQWIGLALPFSLLYKAIKMKFKYSSQQIKQLFGQNDQIYVWRGGKISKQELQQLQNSLKQGKQPFFELSSFTSTSLDKAIAERFLDQQHPQTNCLMKIKLMKPKNRQEIKEIKEIQNFSFIYLSFAIMPTDRINQKQILLNALTMARLTNISYKIKNQLFNLKNLSPQSKQQLARTPRQKIIPIIQLEVGSFEDILQNYSKAGKLNDYQKQVAEHYLITVDFIKNYEFFDIGDSLRLAGELKPAYEYDKQKIKQIEAMNEEQLTNQQLLKHHKRYEQICGRHADTCFNLGYEKEAIDCAELSIQACQQNKQLDKDLTIKQHEQMMNQRLAKKTFMLQFFGKVGQACQSIKDRIKMYEKQITSKTDTQLACQFYIAKLLINLGLIWLMQGKHKKAKKYFDQSQRRIDKILKQIDYESLKTETFYFSLIKEFIIHYIFCGASKFLDKEEFFRIKRTYKIVQATYIFGGAQKFQAVVEKSARLKEYVEKFIQNNKNVKIQNPLEEGGSHQNMLSRVERQFVDSQLNKELEPQVEVFLKQFKQSIKQGEKSTLQKKSKELYGQIFAAVEQKLQEIHNFDLKLNTTKGQLIASKLADWKKIDYSQKNSALSIKQSSERHILKLKEMQNNYLLQSTNINSSQYRHFLTEQANLITKHLQERKDFDYYQPTLQTIKYKLAREEILEKQGNQVKAKIQIEKIIKDTKTNKNYIQRQIEAYLISARIHHSIADFDFLQCLQKLPQDKKTQIKQIQMKAINLCENQLQLAADSIKQFKKLKRNQNRYRISENLLNYFRQMRMKIEQNSQPIDQIRENELNKKLSKQNIEILIWKAKCKILILHYAKQNQRNDRIAKIGLHLDVIASQIQQWEEGQQKTLSHLYNEIRGYYLYANCKIRQGISSLEISLTQQICFAQIQRNFLIKTKLSFMYYVYGSPPSELSESLSKEEQFYINYPFYWRICLANHYNKKKRNKSDAFYIKHCIRSLEQTRLNDEYLRLRYVLIHDYQYKFYLEKQKRASSQNSIRESYIYQRNRQRMISRSNSINLTAEKSRLQRSRNLAIRQNELNLSIQIPKIKEFAQKYQHQKFDIEQQEKFRENQTNKIKNEQSPSKSHISEELILPEVPSQYSPLFKKSSLQENAISNFQSPQNNSNSDQQLMLQGNFVDLIAKSGKKLEQSQQFSLRQRISRKTNSQAGHYTTSLGQIQVEPSSIKQSKKQIELPLSKSHRENSSILFFERYKTVSKQSHQIAESQKSIEKLRPKAQRGINVISKDLSRRLLKSSKRDRQASVELFKRVISNFSQQKQEIINISKQIKQDNAQKPQSKPYSSTNNSSLVDNFMKRKEQAISSSRKRHNKLLHAISNETTIVKEYSTIMKRKQSNMFINKSNKSVNPGSLQIIQI